MTTPTLPTLPCPFCGNEPWIIDDLVTLHVECKNCGSTGAVSSYYNGAIGAWNRRAAIEQQGYKVWYEEAMWESNAAGFSGASAAETIRELDRLYREVLAQQGVPDVEDLKDRRRMARSSSQVDAKQRAKR